MFSKYISHNKKVEVNDKGGLLGRMRKQIRSNASKSDQIPVNMSSECDQIRRKCRSNKVK